MDAVVIAQYYISYVPGCCVYLPDDLRPYVLSQSRRRYDRRPLIVYHLLDGELPRWFEDSGVKSACCDDEVSF